MRKLTFLLLSMCCAIISHAITVKGLVVDETNEPIIGATVIELGKPTNGTSTDIDGAFTIEIPAEGTLKISYIGYTAVEVPVEGRTSISITLKSESTSLDEVVVVAFGQMKKEAFVGSASVMKSDDLAKSQVTNAAQALAGRVAGLQLNNSSSQMGSSPSITIRGVGSISSDTEPLIVVDGMPFDGSLNLINASDIESITVLKDASSNALYGARGANGVVMITTKKAQGKARVTLNAKWGVNSSALQNYKTLNAQQFYETLYQTIYNYETTKENPRTADEAHAYINNSFMNTAESGVGAGYMVYTVPDGQDFIMKDGHMNPNATLGAKYSYQGQELWLQPDDWSEIGLRDGLRQEYNATISGGGNGFNFYTSLGYLDQEGITPNAWEKRLSARAKIDYQAKPWLRVGVNANYTNYKYSQVSEGGLASANGSATNTIGIGSIWSVIKNQAPIYPVYIRDGNGNIMIDQWGQPTYDFGDKYGLHRGGIGSSPSNAIFSNKYRESTSNGNSLQASGYAEFRILPELTFTVNGSTYLYDRKAFYATSPFQDYYTSSDTNGYLSLTKYSTHTYNLQQLLNYDKQIGAHGIEALLGHEYYNYTYNYISGSGNNFGIDNTTEFGTLLNRNLVSSYSSKYNNEGYFIRAIYNYDRRYYVNASFRRDASSRFDKDHRWGSFWSAGAAWVISNEEFFDVDQINNLKFKVSVGSQGNDNIGNYFYADKYDVVNNNDTPAYQWIQKGTKDITWETNTNWNAGVEFDLFNNRLSGSIDYFYRKTSDMLFAITTPPSAGYTSYYANVGDMRNTGFEIVLNGTLMQTKDFTWTANFNIGYVKNKVLKLPDNVKTQSFDGHDGYVNLDKSFVSLYRFAVAEGLPLYSWYTKQSAGVDPETGAALYWKNTKDEAGNIIGRETVENSNEADYYLSGDAMSPWNGGFGTSLTYKGFDLSVNLNFQLGGLVYDYTYQGLMGSGSEATSQNWHEDILKHWTPENSNSSIPRLKINELYSQNAMTDRFLTNASYLNLQNINFGYTLPQTLTSKWGIENLRVYFSGENLAYVSARRGLDPRQTNFGITNPEMYSPTRTISGGVQLTF